MIELNSESQGYLFQHQIQQKQIHARNHLQHVCGLDIDNHPPFVRETNIVCTIGESCDTVEMLEDMIKNGMNVARLNLTLGTYKYHTDVIRRIREAEKKFSQHPHIAIAADITAPTVRTGIFNHNVDNDVHLEEGTFVSFTTAADMEDKSNKDTIWIDSSYFRSVLAVLNVGDRVFIDDGAISVIVREKLGESIRCLVDQGGRLGGSKRLHIPRLSLYRYAVLDKFKQSLLFAVENEVDMVFVSFLESAKDVKKVRMTLGEIGRSILVIAKIETKSAARQGFDEIVAAADGILIARSDIGLEVPLEKVFILQKNIIARCLKARKPVLVAGQMLESMRHHPRATRAETSDVANAVIDGADGLVLGPETAKGNFPLLALKNMHDICREAESAMYHPDMVFELKRLPILDQETDASQATAVSAVEASLKAKASAIIVVTTTGRAAWLVSSYRPICPILAITRHPLVARRCHLYRGVHPVFCTESKMENWCDDMDMRINVALLWARQRGFLSPGDYVIILTGWYQGVGSNSTVRIIEVAQDDKDMKIMTAGQNVTAFDD